MEFPVRSKYFAQKHLGGVGSSSSREPRLSGVEGDNPEKHGARGVVGDGGSGLQPGSRDRVEEESLLGSNKSVGVERDLEKAGRCRGWGLGAGTWKQGQRRRGVAPGEQQRRRRRGGRRSRGRPV